MLLPKKLYLKNFLSFKEEIIRIENNVTTCIMGRNLSDEGSESNGAGKSAIQAAIEFIYTGNVSRKVTKNKLIRRGTDEAIISHVLYNNIKNEYLRITRTIPKKGSERIDVYLYELENKYIEKPEHYKVDIATTKDANDWIINYIGISKEDISNYFIPNEVNYVSFFNASDTKKKELISRFSNANIIDAVFEHIENDVQAVSSEKFDLEQELLKVETRIETRQNDLLIEQERDYESEKSEKILDIRKKIDIQNNKIQKYNEQISDINNNIITLSDELIPKKKEEYEKILKTLESFEKDIYKDKIINLKSEISSKEKQTSQIKDDAFEIKSEIRDIKDDISSMNSVLGGGVSCPKCGHKFNPNADITLEKAEENLKLYEKDLVDFTNDLTKINSTVQTLEEKIKDKYKGLDELKDLREEFNDKKEQTEENESKLLRTLKQFKNEIITLRDDLKDKKDLIQQAEHLIKEFENNIVELRNSTKDLTKEKALKTELKSLEKEAKQIENKILILQHKEELIDEWEIKFKAFKSFLANKKLKVIQNIINKYLEEMNSSLKLKLEGYKQLRNGDIREKITPYIYDNGDICDYGEFSKGERSRIDFATLLTLQTLVNDNCKSGGLDILFMDEIAEGVDAEGLGNLLEAFNKTSKTTLITTHVTNETIYPSILMVEKINKISKIKSN